MGVFVLLGGCGADGRSSAPTSADATAESASASVTGTATAPTVEPSARPTPTTRRTGPLTPTDPDRITPRQRAAIEALAESPRGPPEPSTRHHGHQSSGPATTLALDPDEQAAFDAQWAAAAEAVAGLDTAVERAEAGYVRAAIQVAGIGVHWVNWVLIDEPFDPAHPAMLLVDERDGRAELVGFSYWVRSDGQPEGFAGPNDEWHRHTNLCIVNGWVDGENVEPAECAGELLAGEDLWMLHAWVVPNRANRWGAFAVRHPALCPPASGTPDISRCPGQ